MIKTHGLDHININVSDIKRSLKFYQEMFGMKVMFWDGPRMVFLNTPGSTDTVTLCQANESQPVAGGGVSHFGWSVENKADLDRAAIEIERAGGKVISRGEHAPGHPYLYFSDPDGYVIEI